MKKGDIEYLQMRKKKLSNELSAYMRQPKEHRNKREIQYLVLAISIITGWIKQATKPKQYAKQ